MPNPELVILAAKITAAQAEYANAEAKAASMRSEIARLEAQRDAAAARLVQLETDARTLLR